MLSLLRRIAGDRSDRGEQASSRESAPELVTAAGAQPLAFAGLLDRDGGLPVPDWEPVQQWVNAIEGEERQAQAWLDCERAWLLHLRDALGAGFDLRESPGAAVLSSLEPKLSRYALEFMERTLKRIVHVLKGVAEVPPWGKDLLIVFDDEETYYRYAARYYPDRGEFAFSSGMHISRGCSHYITTKADLRTIEPVLAHEMTHGCLGHLPLPLWLNEGLAVNTEHRLVGPGGAIYTPQEMRAKHLKFWRPAEVQEFWSGKSFRRPDDGNMLSYDLARVLVEQLSADWSRFAGFVNAAHFEDGGGTAARAHLGADLGSIAAAFLERDDAERFEPDPRGWVSAAEHVPADRPFTLLR